MTISVAIQAHPKRTALADALSASLEGAEVVWDPDAQSPLVSPWRTYREALEKTPVEATHRLILQDDVLVVPHLQVVLPRIAARHPDRLIALFVSGYKLLAHHVYAACSRDDLYVTLPTRPWVHTVALLWPASLIPKMLAFVDEQPWPEGFTADDEIVGRAMTALYEPLIATVPSLVEHPDIEPSLIGRHRNYAGADLNRVAACFLDEEVDVRSLDW